MYDILSILIGKWFLGGVGYCVRKFYFFLLRSLGIQPKKKRSRSDFSSVIKIDEYQNRITGFMVILIVIIIIQILQAI
ncbi:hypothetical protein SAMN05421820_103443 [Pedobacter steynii]|uniref:Uncharacterized protein n=1 Tax=Pedobacter steynii TaxID=430522 RepID=A0A1G9S2F5_9SPHI|nr:hypothetical protein SAMN05421820_103443 [Pedobacter steynii]